MAKGTIDDFGDLKRGTMKPVKKIVPLMVTLPMLGMAARQTGSALGQTAAIPGKIV